MVRPPLVRSRDDRVLAGVCTGLAKHLGRPTDQVRAVVAVVSVLGGAGVLLYVWLWLTVPLEGETEGVVPLRRALTRPAVRTPAAAPTGSLASTPVAPVPTEPESRAAPDFSPSSERPGVPGAAQTRNSSRPRWPIAELLLGACFLLAGFGLILDRMGVRINLAFVLPALAVLVGVGLTWWQIADRDRPDQNQLPRVLGALALVAVGVLMFFVTAGEPSAWTVIAAAIAVLAGVALAIAPWGLRLNRELMAERAARAREAERSDIAAHLHDSVLQTLALIQQRAAPGSEVSRLARGQERELREWLFRGADGAAPPQFAAVESALRTHASALENDYAVRFELVVVGAASTTEVPEAIVAAAREAMLNAARHAGGDVTVFLEIAQNRVSIDITDRGPGVNLEALPEGRMGVRESILGRMQRAGGSAKIVQGPGGGTSVRLGIPRNEARGVDGESVDVDVDVDAVNVDSANSVTPVTSAMSADIPEREGETRE